MHLSFGFGFGRLVTIRSCVEYLELVICNLLGEVSCVGLMYIGIGTISVALDNNHHVKWNMEPQGDETRPSSMARSTCAVSSTIAEALWLCLVLIISHF